MLSKLVLLFILFLFSGDINTNIQFKARRDITAYATEVTKGYIQIQKHPNIFTKEFKEPVVIRPAKDKTVLVIDIKANTTFRLEEIGDWDFKVTSTIPVTIIINPQLVTFNIVEMKFKYLRKTRELLIYQINI
jgi:hypothetical protein